MKCPKCKKNINLGKQLNEWDKMYGADVEDYAYINIWCEHCKKMTIGIEVYKDLIDKEVYSTALKKKVVINMPKEEK